jgi:hypothetical protein
MDRTEKRYKGRGKGRYAVEILQENIAEEVFCHSAFGLNAPEKPSIMLTKLR